MWSQDATRRQDCMVDDGLVGRTVPNFVIEGIFKTAQTSISTRVPQLARTSIERRRSPGGYQWWTSTLELSLA